MVGWAFCEGSGVRALEVSGRLYASYAAEELNPGDRS